MFMVVELRPFELRKFVDKVDILIQIVGIFTETEYPESN